MSKASHGFWIAARGLLLVWIVLLGLLAATTCLAFLPLGKAQLEVALAIAGLKVLLVAVFFMDLVRSTPLIRLAAVTSLLWVSFLFALTLADVSSRAGH